MLYEIVSGKPVPAEQASILSERQVFGFFDAEECAPVLLGTGLSPEHLHSLLDTDPMSYENYDGFDVIRLNLPSRAAHSASPERVCIWMGRNTILFFSRDISRVTKFMHDFLEGNVSVGYDRLLSSFFERLTAGEGVHMEKLEKEISLLDDGLITNGKKDCVKEIVALRKKLLNLKKYYEQLLNVLDELLENENELLSERSLHYFRIYNGKLERLYHNVLNLRDYVTQVREAYQAEVDISLNNVMKFFTVITSIFLPLTLIVGWYGMNLQMPEFQWPYAYPAVIVLSVLVVSFCLFYFKKNKWF